jgi:hypothetical protein
MNSEQSVIKVSRKNSHSTKSLTQRIVAAIPTQTPVPEVITGLSDVSKAHDTAGYGSRSTSLLLLFVSDTGRALFSRVSCPSSRLVQHVQPRISLAMTASQSHMKFCLRNDSVKKSAGGSRLQVPGRFQVNV